MQWRAIAACLPLLATAVAAAELDARGVEQRVREWQPMEREKRWEGIGWAPTLRDAERLSREHRRPVFLFTLDGKMSVGRC